MSARAFAREVLPMQYSALPSYGGIYLVRGEAVGEL